jgi:hypothetical protein
MIFVIPMILRIHHFCGDRLQLVAERFLSHTNCIKTRLSKLLHCCLCQFISEAIVYFSKSNHNYQVNHTNQTH